MVTSYSFSVGIGTELTTGNYEYLINVGGRDVLIGETMRFNSTLMYLNAGQRIKVMPISETTHIDNVHFTIKFLGDSNDLI